MTDLVKYRDYNEAHTGYRYSYGQVVKFDKQIKVNEFLVSNYYASGGPLTARIHRKSDGALLAKASPVSFVAGLNRMAIEPVVLAADAEYILTLYNDSISTAQLGTATTPPATVLVDGVTMTYVGGTLYGNGDVVPTAPYNANDGRHFTFGVAGIANTAPNTPPTNNPKGTAAAPTIITTTTPTLDWSFSDPDAGDVQSAYQVRIRDTAAAEGVYARDTGKVASAATDYVVPAAILQVGKTYTWEVTTWDAAGVQSGWSSAEYFKLLTTAAVGDKNTFPYTGAAQTYTVPANVTKIKVEAWGAQGGDRTGGNLGGKGGYSHGELTVQPGQVLGIYVGGRGGTVSNSVNNAPGGLGGYNGGGTGGQGYGWPSGGGGGGATDIRTGGTALANRILVAGGGGGASSVSAGGTGGGLTGGSAASNSNGGTQTTGGLSGGGNSTAGTLGVGGNGFTNGASSQGGGGGGGGLYGGGGGASGHAGGGGSGYVVNTLVNGVTTADQRVGDGQMAVTVLEVTATGTFEVINRSPGTTDQLTPGGNGLTPLFTWDYSGAFVQTKYQIKIFDPQGNLTHDTGLLTSSNKSHQLAAGILQAGVVYGWELAVVDNNNYSYPNSRLYFITNQLPPGPAPIAPANAKRTDKRPVFEATIGNDVENDNQKFVIQLAENAAFTTGLQERSSETLRTGWMVKTTDGEFAEIPAAGVDATYEGGTVQYTWPADLTEGKTYHWRMLAIDGTSGARGPAGAARSVRVGDKIQVGNKTPIITTAHVERMLFTIQKTIATDGQTPATFKLEVSNNALDAEPTWEDATGSVETGDYHIFTNAAKTAEQWAVGFKITVEANDSLGAIEIAGVGFSFD